MTDKEKIIKGLESCRNHTCSDCPYSGEDCMTTLYDDTLQVLSAVEPTSETNTTTVWKCGKCGVYIGYANFCPACGQAVKWSEPKTNNE